MDKLGTLIKYDILGLRFVLITSKMFVSACKITYCDRQGTTEPPSPCAVTEARAFARLCVPGNRAGVFRQREKIFLVFPLQRFYFGDNMIDAQTKQGILK